MGRSMSYNGSLTAEQFLFSEIRIVSRLHLEGYARKELIEIIQKGNLFQYPTEREVARIARACHRRVLALENETLTEVLAHGPTDVAKQINLYAIMRDNCLVWDFMVRLIGEKFRSRDLSLSLKDVNVFFADLQAQEGSVSAWSEKTVQKIKSVLVRMLVETEYLDRPGATVLNPVFLCEELEQGILENQDFEALPAFHYFGRGGI